MTTVRGPKLTKNFTITANSIHDDWGISLRARGLLAYILSKPDDWDVRPEVLARHAQEGVKAIYAALKELEEAQYRHVWSVRVSKGRFEKKVIHHDYRCQDSECPGYAEWQKRKLGSTTTDDLKRDDTDTQERKLGLTSANECLPRWDRVAENRVAEKETRSDLGELEFPQVAPSGGKGRFGGPPDLYKDGDQEPKTVTKASGPFATLSDPRLRGNFDLDSASEDHVAEVVDPLPASSPVQDRTEEDDLLDFRIMANCDWCGSEISKRCFDELKGLCEECATSTYYRVDWNEYEAPF